MDKNVIMSDGVDRNQFFFFTNVICYKFCHAEMEETGSCERIDIRL